MPAIINSDNGVSSGSAGLKTTGGNDGILNIQTNGVNAVTVTSGQQVGFNVGTASLPSITATNDTNTGIYFPAADTIGFVCGGTEDFRIDSTGQLWNTVESTVGTDYTTLYRGYMARAWVNFNGTGTVAIRASGNVSSITDNGTGNWTINFATAMPDANYCPVLGAVGFSSTDNGRSLLITGNGTTNYAPLTKSTTQLSVTYGGAYAQNSAMDSEENNVAIFR